ncbi:PREDICTED: uncharacterized protein LOC105144612 [Acromyrmex echinatior]|uniref:uncharacterized protein LOC105144612 n=1 Tax=Acromyrmex echinatior TaxID=103372 RepID=UPI000580FE19|nr:PREDICTED: uncharacterized protein LOC105144612 [Acromyrmex echinatior]
MNKDVVWARACLRCQQAKIARHNRLLSKKLPVPDAHFDHLDIIEPMLPSHGFKYCLTLIDRFSSQRRPRPTATLFDALVKLVGTKRIRTTAYHQQSNELIERWYRSLKAAIMCQVNAEWADVLPIVLLGLHSSYKEDIHASTRPRKNSSNSRFMQRIRLIPTTHHIRNKSFRYKDLHTYTHAFLKNDTVKYPLECPY